MPERARPLGGIPALRWAPALVGKGAARTRAAVRGTVQVLASMPEGAREPWLSRSEGLLRAAVRVWAAEARSVWLHTTVQA